MTPTRPDLRDQLRAAGARPAPDPSPEFVAGLQARITDASFAGSPVIPLRSPSRSVVRPVLTGVAAAAAAVVLAGSFAGWWDSSGASDEPPREALALAAAVDTVVVLPGGNQVLGTVGLLLPEDTVVRTGPSGSATVGSTRLGPQQEAVVDAGQLHLKPPAGAAAAIPTPTAAVTVPTSAPPTTATTKAGHGTLPGITLPPLTLPTLTLPPLSLLPRR
jgi:hypothetical protein